jgi:phosphotransferase system HPr-like phosphotransfer protein
MTNPELLNCMPPSPAVSRVEMTLRQEIRVAGACGLTMLRCTHLIAQFHHFRGSIKISNAAISVDGRSMIDLLQLAAVDGTLLTIELTGQNAEPIMSRVASLLAHEPV